VKTLLAWAFGLILSGCTSLPGRLDPHHLALRNPQPSSSPVVLDRATRIAAIDAVLDLVQRHHVDGIEPQRLAEWRSQLLLSSLAMPESEFWARLDRQLGEFEDSHTRLQSPDQVRLRGREPQPGLRVRRSGDGSLRIIDVEPGSPAETLGIAMGWTIVSLNGYRLADHWGAHAARAESSPRAAEQRALLNLWQSSPPPWSLEVVDLEGQTRRVKLEAAPPPQSSHRWEDDGRLYLRLAGIDDDALAEARRALSGSTVPREVVLDLRGNRGGAGAVALQLIALFVRGNHDVARLQTRDGSPIRQYGRTIVPLVQQARGVDLYRGPVVVLMDAATASSAELLAGSLQALGRALLIGETSCGCMNPSLGWFAVPGGAQVLITEARATLANGRIVERVGLLPDSPSRPEDAMQVAARVLEQARR
jgi:carboxyl-terminal processing protease